MSVRQFNLDLADEVFVTEFAGGGGACEGYFMATGRHVDAAVNHDPEAVAMHRMNHPLTHHYCQDVWKVDPVTDILEFLQRRRVAGAWFSPDCRHHSKAKGGACLDKRVRGLAWMIRKWIGRGGARRVGPGKAGRVRSAGPACPRSLYMENVEEFANWGPLIAKRDAKTGLVVKKDKTIAAPGERVPYREQWLVPDPSRVGLYHMRLMRFIDECGGRNRESRSLRMCDYGVPTIRKRHFMITNFDGRAVAWAKPTHGKPETPEVQAGTLQPHLWAAGCIDFTLPCPSIFLSKDEAKKVRCKRPLVEATLQRLATGIDRHVLKAAEPFIVCLTHQGGDRTESVTEPGRSVTGAHRGERAFVSPFVAHAQHGGRSRPATAPAHTIAASKKDQNQIVMPYFVPRYGERPGQEPRSRGVAQPGPTVVNTGNGGSLAAVSLTKFNTGSVGQPLNQAGPTVTANSYIKRPGGAAPIGLLAAHFARQFGTAIGAPVDRPGPTVMSDGGGGKTQVVATFLAQQNGGEKGHQSYGHPVNSPASTLSTKGCQQQVVFAGLTKYYKTQQNAKLDEPGHTVTTEDRFSLFMAEAAIPVFGPEHEEGARRVAKFLRDHGVEFEGEYAMVGDLVLVDIGMRMLVARELYRIQGFPDSYIIDRGLQLLPDGRLVEIPLSGTAQVKMCGNSVCPPMAAALIAANQPELVLQKVAA